jgi:hypothetical protein
VAQLFCKAAEFLCDNGRIDPRSWLESVRVPETGAWPNGVKERIAAQYAAKVTWMDHWFGYFLDALEETGSDKRTAVTYTLGPGDSLHFEAEQDHGPQPITQKVRYLAVFVERQHPVSDPTSGGEP